LANYIFHQWRRLLGRAPGVIPAVPPRPLPLEVVDGPEEARALPRISGVAGYSWPGGVGAASYVGRLTLALAFLREGGGVVKVSFELAILDATASSSSVVSEELGSGGCEKMLGGGTMTEESAVVDVRGIRTGWYNESRPEDELVSGTGTPYRERGSAWVGFVTIPLGPASATCALTGVMRDGGCDGEDTE